MSDKRDHLRDMIDMLLGGGGSKVPPTATAAASGQPPPNVKVTAKIPPVAQYGSYALHEGCDVYTDPPVGRKIAEAMAREWLEDQIDYYTSQVVTGNNYGSDGLLTSSGATLGQFVRQNVYPREDGFSFRFQQRNHPAGMPYAQLATFIEVQKQVPIITVDTAHLAAVVREELE